MFATKKSGQPDIVADSLSPLVKFGFWYKIGSVLHTVSGFMTE